LARIASESGIASLEYQPEVESTSDWALRLVADDSRPFPLLVLTGRQTSGRGRGSNRWFSSDGALTFSLVVDGRTCPPEHWSLLALATGLGVCEALEDLFLAGLFAVKWPNDVYLGQQKICGILVEAPSQSERRAVIGIGVNVNNRFADAPPEIQAKAVSLADAAGGTFDLTDALIGVVQRVLSRIASLAETGLDLTAFAERSLLDGRNVQVQVGREILAGRCLGIAPSGALRLQTPTGEREIHAGVVLGWE
jgi:BirA family biotin operon repressor/biotin-[acetyl-CoA-carboxylase] ligase